MDESDSIYRICYYNRNQLYELYASSVYQGNLYGFIEVEGLIFGKRSEIVLDPSEEKLRAEFKEVKRSYIPMHSIVRIDEVERAGRPQAHDESGVPPIYSFTPPKNKGTSK